MEQTVKVESVFDSDAFKELCEDIGSRRAKMDHANGRLHNGYPPGSPEFNGYAHYMKHHVSALVREQA